MQDSQNGLKLANAAPESEASSSFFGAATLSETKSPAAATGRTPSATPKSETRSPVEAAEGTPSATPKKDNGLVVAPPPPKASGGLTVKAAAPPTPAAVPAVPSSATAGAPAAAKPLPPPPAKSVAPPPIPVKGPVSSSVPQEASGGHGKLWLSLLVLLLLLGGAGFWGVRYGLPMVMQRMGGDLELEWAEIPAMPAVSQPWPYIEVNGVHGSGETGRAILSGELVPVGNRSREGVEVAEVESGRVLLRFGGEERYILVGDRTY